MHYFVGIVLLGAGVILILKTEWFLINFGSSGWAEEHMGTSGGSRILYKFIGLLLILVGFLAITNMYGGFLMATVGRLFIR